MKRDVHWVRIGNEIIGLELGIRISLQGSRIVFQWNEPRFVANFLTKAQAADAFAELDSMLSTYALEVQPIRPAHLTQRR